MSMDFPTSVKGMPFLPMEFDKRSYRVDPGQASDLLSYIQTSGVTDLLVLAHGWNNDEADAFRLYKNLLSSISKEADVDFNARTVAVLGVFWPSKKFADGDLIPGGAASFDDDLPPDVLIAEIEAMRGFFDTDDAEEVLDRLVELVPDLSNKKSARTEFGEKVRSLLGDAADDDDELSDEIPDTFFDMEGDQILEELAAPRDEEGAPGSRGSGDEGGIAAVGGVAAGAATGDPTGGVAGLGSFFRGIRSGAGSALNMVTYWKMKSRAGQVGRSGLAPLLAEVRAKAPALRIHLVGHSFGGRLVAAAALGKDDADPVLPITSMTLLQAAFSHNGFAENWEGSKDGYFRDVYADARVSGPTLVTYTENDRANRLAYPLASRLARQTAAELGGAGDKYGAIGANGAQNTPEAVAGTLVSRRGSYAFENGKVHNLEASEYVENHGDVAGREIANAIIAAIATPAPDIAEESVAGHDGASETGSARFDEENLDSTIIAVPLIKMIRSEEAGSDEPYELIVDLNLQHEAGMSVARDIVYIEIFGYDVWLQGGANRATIEYLTEVREAQDSDNATDLMQWQGVTERSVDEVVDLAKAIYTPQYVYPKLTAKEISALVAIDAETKPHALYKVWPDFKVKMMLTSSVATVKGDAARVAFSAAGKGIVWAVADTGIDGSHHHFQEHKNLDLSDHLPLKHVDFTGNTTTTFGEPEDNHGHGTHVAGIIAGESTIKEVEAQPGQWMPQRWAGTAERDKEGDRQFARRQIKEPITGCAPLAKLVSLKVLKDSGTGKVSNLLAATGYVQAMNDHGRLIRIHGLNMSVGYGFDPEWFGCGQSPLCVEVDRLVRSGVSVVVAAGNTGYWQRGGTEAVINSGLDLTINDPGNAELAITVGSTHREKPHTYGVSYFSSKGPTGDGRQKPDLVAPGEKVLSCATGKGRDDIEDKLTGADEGESVDYRQESGTSMAAPHVSGAVAAFLSVRKEFIGQPQRVKEIFLSSATDLGRDRYFQGHGLVDVMRAMQSL